MQWVAVRPPNLVNLNGSDIAKVLGKDFEIGLFPGESLGFELIFTRLNNQGTKTDKKLVIYPLPPQISVYLSFYLRRVLYSKPDQKKRQLVFGGVIGGTWKTLIPDVQQFCGTYLEKSALLHFDFHKYGSFAQPFWLAARTQSGRRESTGNWPVEAVVRDSLLVRMGPGLESDKFKNSVDSLRSLNNARGVVTSIASQGEMESFINLKVLVMGRIPSFLEQCVRLETAAEFMVPEWKEWTGLFFK